MGEVPREAGSALGLLANLKDTRKVKRACQVEATSIKSVELTSDACDSKKEIMRLKSGLQSEDRGACY